MAVLSDQELAALCVEFVNADVDKQLDLAYSAFGDFIDTIEYLKSRLELAEKGEKIRDMKRKAYVVEH